MCPTLASPEWVTIRAVDTSDRTLTMGVGIGGFGPSQYERRITPESILERCKWGEGI
jgi:hypothetical protein